LTNSTLGGEEVTFVKGGLNMHFVRQLLLPLAVLFAFVGALSGGADPVRGNVSNISPTAMGSTISVTATYTNSPAGTPASLSAAGNGSFSTASATGGTGVTATGLGSKEIRTTPDTSGQTTNLITIQATFSCQGNGPVSFLLLQVNASPNSQTASANCTGSTTTTSTTSSGTIAITPSQQSVGQPVNISTSCPAGSVLSASPQIGSFVSATLNASAVSVSGGSVSCSTAGTLQAVYNCTQQGVTTFTLSGVAGASGSLSCGSTSQTGSSGTSGTNTGLTLANPSGSGSNSPVSVSVTPGTVACGATAQVTVSSSLVANAPVQDGTVVNLYTTNGIVNPKTGVIKDGKFTTTLTAPATGGNATVNASVGGVTNYTDVKFDCALGSAPATTSTALPPVSAPLTSPPPPPVAPPIGSLPAITPPSTGDAGLKLLE
jgi:hypothetical protein